MTQLVEILAPFETAPPDVRVVVLCHLVSDAITIDPAERNAAVRRAALLLATGGDPRRPLELDGRAVGSLADDLDSDERRAQLAAGLDALTGELRAGEPTALPQAAATLATLLADPALAWCGYAAAILADALADSDD